MGGERTAFCLYTTDGYMYMRYLVGYVLWHYVVWKFQMMVRGESIMGVAERMVVWRLGHHGGVWRQVPTIHGVETPRDTSAMVFLSHVFEANSQLNDVQLFHGPATTR